jgi:hypothetical protein
MALRVPDKQIVHIKKLLELPDDKVAKFLDALSKVGPQFNVDDLSTEVSERLDLPREFAWGVIKVLISLYLTRTWKQPVERFVDRDVHAALKKAKVFSTENSDAEWQKLRKFLISALSLERTVGTAAKAGNVLTQHERIFANARIMTDVRPIFHLDVSEKPESAVIVHMLKITQRDNFGNHADQYFALDSNDIATMQGLLDRAVMKEKTLRAVMKESGVTVLDPKLFF